MQIKIETLEKLQVINFYPEKPLLIGNVCYVADKTNQPQNSLFQNILNLRGVCRLLATAELLSIRYENTDIEELKMLIMAELDDYFATAENLVAETVCATDKENAEAVADALIRPTLNRDGGDIVIHSVQNGIIELSFAGHCAGCPYAENTLQNVIRKAFVRCMPQIREIKMREAK